MGEKINGLDFLRFAGAGTAGVAAAVILGGCARKDEPSLFFAHAEGWPDGRKERIALGPGMGAITLTDDTKFTVVQTVNPAAEIDLVADFYNQMANPPGNIKVRSEKSFNNKDKVARAMLTGTPLPVYAVRWQGDHNPAMSLLVGGPEGVLALTIKGGAKNLKTLQFAPTEFWGDQAYRKPMETLQVITARMIKHPPLTDDDSIHQAVIIPGDYDPAYRDAIAHGSSAVEAIRFLNDQYHNFLAPAFFDNQAISWAGKPIPKPQPDFFLPLAAAVQILGLAQRGDGKVFALIQLNHPESSLAPSELASLQQKAASLWSELSYENTLMWVDLENIQAELSLADIPEERRRPTPSPAPSPTATMTESPTETATPYPSQTPVPTSNPGRLNPDESSKDTKPENSNNGWGLLAVIFGVPTIAAWWYTFTQEKIKKKAKKAKVSSMGYRRQNRPIFTGITINFIFNLFGSSLFI